MWTVPARRMKSRIEHRVPLSRQVIKVLHEARALSGDADLVFPGNQGGMQSDSTFSKLFRELELGCHPHGFRSSFRVWSAEEQTSASWAAIELSLAHAIGSSTERAYFHSDLLEQRRELMQAWADYLSPD